MLLSRGECQPLGECIRPRGSVRPILEVMQSQRRIRGLSVTSAALAAVFLLASCGADTGEGAGPDGSEPGEGGVATAQPAAPAPKGDQHSHEDMAAALDEVLDDASLTDTDDWWESLREINRELQKLRVSPSYCKAYVTSSASPVPAGALAAVAEHDSRRTAVYSFEGSEEAQHYANQEVTGAEECDEHTVIRELSSGDLEAETALTEVEVRSGADDALAVSSVVEADGETQNSLILLLRHQSTVVTNAEVLDEPLGTGEAEALAAELEQEAAAVLAAVTGDEIESPESEEDAEEDPDDDDG